MCSPRPLCLKLTLVALGGNQGAVSAAVAAARRLVLLVRVWKALEGRTLQSNEDEDAWLRDLLGLLSAQAGHPATQRLAAADVVRIVDDELAHAFAAVLGKHAPAHASLALPAGLPSPATRSAPSHASSASTDASRSGW